jgi:hypothetical protein
MRHLLVVGLLLGGVAASNTAAAQAGISLGAAVGSTWADNKLQSDDRHGLVYLRLGAPLLPFGARGEFMAFDEPGSDYDTAVIGSAVIAINAPLVQPYLLLGYGKYGLKSNVDATGVSYGAGVRIGGRLGLFVEARRHDPINRDLISLGLAF